MQLTCPECGAQVPAENVNIQEMVAVCPSCDMVFKIDLSDPTVEKAKRRKVKRPQPLSILADDANHLHMAFRTNFRLDKHETFLSSAILSVVFTSLTIMFINIYAAEPDLPFMLPLGFGTAALFAYYVLGLIAFNKTHIIMDDDSVRVSRKPLPNILREDHQVSLHGAVAIRCEETEASIKHNYDTPRYRVWAEMADGRRKTIIMDVTEEYAYYIARRLDERLHEDVSISADTSRLMDEGDIIDEGQFDEQSVGDLLQSPQSSR